MTVVRRPTSVHSDDGALEDTIGKASEVVEALATVTGDRGATDEVRQKLEEIENRQKRIEGLLQMLVEQKG